MLELELKTVMSSQRVKYKNINIYAKMSCFFPHPLPSLFLFNHPIEEEDQSNAC